MDCGYTGKIRHDRSGFCTTDEISAENPRDNIRQARIMRSSGGVRGKENGGLFGKMRGLSEFHVNNRRF
jgi:hypothetical protein